jgi:oligopeptide transport system substrate-binding protein
MNREDLTGLTLGQYELREKLGAGGMGTVYRAYQANLKRIVAIKVLPADLSQSPGYLERFNREATTAASLEHAHIVPVYDYGTQRNISYVVMRLLTGGSLSARLAQRAGERNPLPSLGETADLLKQLASALDYAHSQGVIHRDIKPGNVMFDNQGDAYLVDFGIAKLLESTSRLTGTGMTMGTPSYMAPEQWRAEEVGPATDQYALGVMAYELVTGRLPFEAPTPYSLMHKHLNELPTPPHAWRPDIPEAVTQVLLRAMAKSPDERFPTVTAFAQAFDAAVQGAKGALTGVFSAPLRRKVEPSPQRVAPPRTQAESGFLAPTGGGRVPFYRQPRTWCSVVAFLLLLAVLAAGALILPRLAGTPPAVSQATGVVAVPTFTATPAPTSTAFNPDQLVAATRTQRAILTANALASQPKTPTETLNAEETLVAVLVMTDAAETARAAPFTRTPTLTPTPLPPTVTPTVTATATFSPLPPSATRTRTATLRPTATASRTRQPTITVPPTAAPYSGPTVDRTITLALGQGSPSSIDPALVADSAAWQVALETHYPLVRGLETDLATLLPGMAESWEVSADGLTYTFHIRQGIPWVRWNGKQVVPASDASGKPLMLTASDFEYGIQRTLDPATNSSYAFALTPVIKSVRAIDDYTLTITLTGRAAYVYGLLALPQMAAQPRPAIEQYGDQWTQPGNSLSYGPYVVSAWSQDQSLTLAENPFWPGIPNSPKPGISQVQFLFDNNVTHLSSFQSGDADVAAVSSTELVSVQADPALSKELTVAPDFFVYYYGFNVTKPPFDNVHMRRAFSLAVDRQALVENVLKGGQEPARWFSRPGMVAAPTLKDSPALGIGYDPEAARQELQAYLKETGITLGQMPPVNLTVNSVEVHLRIAQAIQQMWQNVLGIKVELTQQEWTVYLQTLAADAPQVWRLGWAPDYPDADSLLREVFHSGSSNNYTKWANPDFDRLVDAAAVEPDVSKRVELYRQAEDILVNRDAAIIPLYWYTRLYLTRPDINRTFAVVNGDERIEKWTVRAP